jgi:Ca2+-binding RTX toxin-like protein
LDIVYQDATPASNKVSIELNTGGAIEVRDANGTLINCAVQPQPLLSNVDQIVATDNVAAHDSTFSISERNGAYLGGGVLNDATGAPEVEIQYAGADGTDQLQVDGTDNADNWLFGENAVGVLGANLNGDDDGDDVTATGVEKADINGGKGDDTVSAVGNSGIPAIAAPLTLDPGNLILEGGNQNDILRGGAGNDNLLGGTQDDDLNGGGGNDSLDGGSEDDSLDGGVGADNMIGNTGIDFGTYGDQTGAVNVSLDGVANDGGTPDGFADNVQTDVENVKGGAGADNIIGSVLNNELTGNAGNDTVDGGAGNDKVSGSGGDDRLLGNVGNDKIFGGDGRDNQVGASGNDTITGNAGVDIFLGKKGLDRLIAKDGTRDKKIDCGPGANKHESFTRDHKDPKPKSC